MAKTIERVVKLMKLLKYLNVSFWEIKMTISVNLSIVCVYFVEIDNTQIKPCIKLMQQTQKPHTNTSKCRWKHVAPHYHGMNIGDSSVLSPVVFTW